MVQVLIARIRQVRQNPRRRGFLVLVIRGRFNSLSLRGRIAAVIL